MTVTINGTTGIAGVDGSAATPAVQGVDTNTGVFYGTDIVGISTGGTERMRINASGQAEFAAGTAALPAIATTGDTNTGIFFSAADTIDFAEGGVATGQFDSSGNFKFNSGYGSASVAYGCRAWVNFNGSANTNLTGTYSQSGTTVTVTATAHGYIVGSSISADITSGTGVDGTYTVTAVTDANTFTYTAGTSLTTSGNISLLRNTIRGSGNVTSVTDNGTGDYTVNFTTAMPDANYAVTQALRVSSSATATETAGERAYATFSSYATSSVRMIVQDVASTTARDVLYGNVMIVR